jgi:hypothetical protein
VASQIRAGILPEEPGPDEPGEPQWEASEQPEKDVSRQDRDGEGTVRIVMAKAPMTAGMASQK